MPVSSKSPETEVYSSCPALLPNDALLTISEQSGLVNMIYFVDAVEMSMAVPSSLQITPHCFTMTNKMKYFY